MQKEPTFFIVWNPQHGNPTYRHAEQDRALAEAERLARENPGQSFYVLEAITKSEKADVVTMPLVDCHDIPF